MIREAVKEDLQVIVNLENSIFPEDPWSEQNYEYELNENPYACIYVYEKDGNIVGYLDLWITFEQAQIANIGVISDYRNQGIATQLMNYAVERCEEQQCENMTLEVRKSNDAAISLYQKYGFIKAGTRKNYYEDGEDAYLMIRPLGGISL